MTGIVDSCANLRHILYRIFEIFYFDCTSSFKRFSNIFWTAWPKELMGLILDRKFKTPYVKIIKFDNFRKINGLGSSFPKFPQYLKYAKTSITQPLDCLGTWVRLHSLWNVMLKTLDYFLCFSTHDLGYLGPVSLNCPNAQIPVKQV